MTTVDVGPLSARGFMWGNVLTGAFSLEGLAERTLNGARLERESLRSRNLLDSFRPPGTNSSRRTKMTKNTTTNNYRIRADQLQNLEIDRNGRVTPRLHDLDPFQNTLLSVLYPGSR